MAIPVILVGIANAGAWAYRGYKVYKTAKKAKKLYDLKKKLDRLKKLKDARKKANKLKKKKGKCKACKKKIKCFKKKKGVTDKEFAKQLQEQENAINSMSPKQLLDNMKNFAANGRGAGDAAARTTARS